MSANPKDIDVDIDLVFRWKKASIPSPIEQCVELWEVAKTLGWSGIDVSQWGIGDVDDSGALANTQAFNHTGPTDNAIKSVIESPDIQEQSFSVWNGIEGQNGAALSINYSLNNLSIFELKSEGLERLYSSKTLVEVLIKALSVWPAAVAQVGPYLYSQKKVFPNRPGVGWMLYLPYALSAVEIPEARALIPVMRDSQQQGTIIVSVTDEVFDVHNRAHVKAANDIEIRLADQDLLPRFIDL